MRLSWRNRWYEVATIQDEWKVRGRHWYLEESRRYFQIQTADHRIMTVCQKETEDTWLLVRMVD